MIKDEIPVESLQYLNSPSPVLFKNTVELRSVTFNKDLGISFELGPFNWPDYTPPKWDGPIYCTLWAGFKINGLWYCAGFMQFYRNKNWTGAPLLVVPTGHSKLNWNVNWAYDNNRWPNLTTYIPKVGDEMLIFLTAGNARKGSAGPEPDITSVAERTNIITVKLPDPKVQTTKFTFTNDPIPNPDPIPTPVPTPVPTPDILNEINTTLKMNTELLLQLLMLMKDTQAQVIHCNQKLDDPLVGKLFGYEVVLRRKDE